MSVFAFVPVVSSVDSIDDVRFDQTGVLLTVPTTFGATRANGSERREQRFFWGFF